MSERTTILVTGGCGFIGTNFIKFMMEKYNQYRIVNIDKITYAANNEGLSVFIDDPRYKFIMGDICNRELVEYIFDEYNVKGVIHFAAESHVDNSIIGPDVFIRTNILGTFVLLDVARKKWFITPHEPKVGYEDCRFHHISTDEVYGTLDDEGLFSENSSYQPNSPYSASKASSDMLVRSYYHTYGMNVTTTNCSNNYGPYQHAEKLIPTIIRKALSNEQIPIYGNGLNVRDWLHVLDHCRGIDTVFHFGKSGETYNIGGRNEHTNIDIARYICAIMDDLLPLDGTLGINSYSKLITFVNDRPGHDKRYAIDASKVKKQLGWMPQIEFKDGLRQTILWYLNHLKV